MGRSAGPSSPDRQVEHAKSYAQGHPQEHPRVRAPQRPLVHEAHHRERSCVEEEVLRAPVDQRRDADNRRRAEMKCRKSLPCPVLHDRAPHRRNVCSLYRRPEARSIPMSRGLDPAAFLKRPRNKCPDKGSLSASVIPSLNDPSAFVERQSCLAPYARRPPLSNPVLGAVGSGFGRTFSRYAFKPSPPALFLECHRR
jgi:hypothetical protein